MATTDNTSSKKDAPETTTVTKEQDYSLDAILKAQAEAEKAVIDAVKNMTRS